MTADTLSGMTNSIVGAAHPVVQGVTFWGAIGITLLACLGVHVVGGLLGALACSGGQCTASFFGFEFSFLVANAAMIDSFETAKGVATSLIDETVHMLSNGQLLHLLGL